MESEHISSSDKVPMGNYQMVKLLSLSFANGSTVFKIHFVNEVLTKFTREDLKQQKGWKAFCISKNVYLQNSSLKVVFGWCAYGCLFLHQVFLIFEIKVDINRVQLSTKKARE